MHSYKKALAGGLIALASIHASGVMLNEIRTDQPDNPDDEEFVELRGQPGESLDGVWFLYIGDHSGAGSSKGSGVVEIALDLSGYSIPDDGHFLMVGGLFDGAIFDLSANDVDYLFEGFGNALENSDNTTGVLVRNFTGNGGNEIRGIDDQLGDSAVDIDDDDDGVPNATLPWDETLDAVGLVEGPPPEFNYGEALGFVNVGPVGGFVPSHVYRTSDTEEWFSGEYVLYEEDVNGQIIGLNPDATDTPGSINPIAPEATFEPSIDSISTIFAKAGDVVTLSGTNLDLVTAVEIGSDVAAFSVSGSDLDITVPDGASTGYVMVTNPDGTATTVNLLVIADLSGAVLVEDFADGLSTFNTYSVASTANWEGRDYRDSNSVQINGYGADVASDDWLISPVIDLSEVSGAYLMFGHERAYGGPDLELKISSDYTGSGDPAAATWAFLDATFAGESSNEVTDSGEVDLSAYEGQTVYIAFRYTSDGTGPGDGAIDSLHYFVVNGESASLGWVNTPNFGWLYYETADWAVSAELGSIYMTSFPWIYQVNFGYLYHVAYADGLGFWFYSPSPTLEWVFVPQGNDGWFQSSGDAWEWDNFKDPQP